MVPTTRLWLLRALSCGLVFAVLGGCSRDVRLADRRLRSVTVGSVSHYGITLDEKASPAQVAYVLLRAIRDDFLASTEEEREAVLDKQFDICAANVIAAKNWTHVSRDEYVYHVVYRWTPTVSHYVQDFETDWDKAKARFVQRAPKSAERAEKDVTECEIRMEVNDPRGDPNARAVMVVWLVKDSGFWRVVHLGFDPTRRSIDRGLGKNSE